LAFSLGEFVQVSCNIIDANAATLSSVYDQVLGILPRGGRVDHCELVGLLPASMLESEDPSRWGELGIARELTIEARLA
jgi:glutamate formiminotransferase